MSSGSKTKWRMKWRGVTGFQECLEEREAALAARGAGSAVGLCDWWEVWSPLGCTCMVRVWENRVVGEEEDRDRSSEWLAEERFLKGWFSCCLRILGNSGAVLFPYTLTKFQAQLIKVCRPVGIISEWKDRYGKSPLGIEIPKQLYTGSCYHRDWAPEHLSPVLVALPPAPSEHAEPGPGPPDCQPCSDLH